MAAGKTGRPLRTRARMKGFKGLLCGGGGFLFFHNETAAAREIIANCRDAPADFILFPFEFAGLNKNNIRRLGCFMETG